MILLRSLLIMNKDVNIIKGKVGIIGMGPAGITASIYLKRFNIEPICFEKGEIGGKVNTTSEIENYPGYVGSVENLLNNFKTQLKNYNIDVRHETVEQVLFNDDETFKIVTDNAYYQFDAVLLATGLKEREYKIPNQETYNSLGISRCAVCDGNFYRNLPVCVVGGGNSAFEEALYLASICSKVTLINRRDEFRADKSLVDEFRSLKNTEILTPYVISNSKGDMKLRHLTLTNPNDNTTREIDTEGLFIYVGSAPVSEFIKIDNLVNARGFVPTNNVMETSVKGFFVAGDCRDTPLRQIVTATNDGALASISIRKFLKEKNGK